MPKSPKDSKFYALVTARAFIFFILALPIFLSLVWQVMLEDSQATAIDISIRIILGGIVASIVSIFLYHLSTKWVGRYDWVVKEFVLLLAGLSGGITGLGIFLLGYSLFL